VGQEAPDARSSGLARHTRPLAGLAHAPIGRARSARRQAPPSAPCRRFCGRQGTMTCSSGGGRCPSRSGCARDPAGPHTLCHRSMDSGARAQLSGAGTPCTSCTILGERWPPAWRSPHAPATREGRWSRDTWANQRGACCRWALWSCRPAWPGRCHRGATPRHASQGRSPAEAGSRRACAWGSAQLQPDPHLQVRRLLVHPEGGARWRGRRGQRARLHAGAASGTLAGSAT
jgi:hypothetical protein